MPQLTELRLTVARELRGELGLPGVLTTDQARLFSQAVRLGWRGAGLTVWTPERRAQQINDARRLVEMAAVFTELGETIHAEDLWRRAGELFEWLARSAPPAPAPAVRFVPLTLLGAASFHLAGLPAMASALLAQARPGIPAGAIFAAFLRADFAGVLDAAAEFWNANPDFTRPAAEVSMKPDDPAFLGVELVRSLGLIAAALRMNQLPRLALALARLRALARVATRARTEDLWLVMELTAQVAERYAAQSLWAGVTPLWHRMSPEGRQRIASYVGAMFGSERGLLWPSQREGVARLVQGGSFALCTPTGSGKTTVAELALLDALYAVTAPTAPLAIYLVPSRALAAEVEARLAGSIGRVDSKLTITGLYGGTEWSLSDAWVTAEGPTVLVSTVEMAEALMRHLGPLLIPRLALVVVDEAHQVQFVDGPQYQENLRRADHRAARLEQFLMRLFACAPQSRALALSAVAGGVETAIACWMSRDEKAQPAGSRYRSTRQLIGALECRANNTVSVRLERLDGGDLQLAGREDAAYIPVPFTAMPAVTGPFRSNMSRFARAHSLWAALQIAKAGRTVLVSITRDIETVAADFRELLEKVPSWIKAKVDVLRPDGAEVFAACVAACEDYCGSESNELFLLRRGIAVHHGQLPVRVRRLMTDVIRAGATPVAVATSTLTEGVNLPFDVVLVPSILRSQFVGYQADGTAQYGWSILSAAEFLNLAGRAGRPGTMGEGLTLVALPFDATSGPNTKARRTQEADIRAQATRFQQLLASLRPSATGGIDPKSPIAELLRLLHALWQRLMPLGTDAQFLAWLEVANNPATPLPPAGPAAEAAEALDSIDLVLLAAIQEIETLRGAPLAPAELETHLRRVWSCSFARFASAQQERLGGFFVKRGSVLPERMYPDAARRRELYRLGLPPRQGAAFLTTAARIEEQLHTLDAFPHWTPEERFAFVKGLGDLAQETPGFRFRITGIAEWSEVLRWWLQAPGARQPLADEVQSWLRMATSDFEYRLGTAIGTVLSSIWNRVRGDALEVPNLEEWRAATGLPWSAIWIRELLAWGTLEPVVAYLMATNRAASRLEGQTRLPEYVAWLEARDGALISADIYHPQRLREWAEDFQPRRTPEAESPLAIPAGAVGEFPPRSPAFPVVSLVNDDRVSWLDPAGYVLAHSRHPDSAARIAPHQRAWFHPSAAQVTLTTW
jgi:hypothetical protein